MAVTFAGHLLTARQNGFDIAHRDMHVGGVGSILLDDAGDELALLAGERTEYLLIFGAAEQLGDDLTRRDGRSHAGCHRIPRPAWERGKGCLRWVRPEFRRRPTR